MKINLDDPKLTAYALGELPEPERSAVAQAIANSPEAQALVNETRQLARMLRGEFEHDLEEAGARRISILPLPEERASWPDTRWSSLGIAALLAVGAITAAVVISEFRTGPRVANDRRGKAPPLLMEFDIAPDANAPAAVYIADGDEDRFVPVASRPVSTFPLQVGTTSYKEVQRQIASGVRPAREAVRIEEMINHFSYDYPSPEGDSAFTITIDAAICPWEPAHQLVRIGVRGREHPPGDVIASDAAIEVQFERARIASYRLIGYERRGDVAAERSDGPAHLAAGHTTTALYEVTPAAETAAAAGHQLVQVRLSHKEPGTGTARAVEASFNGTATEFAQAPADFRFAAVVAHFGMMLRDPPEHRTASFATLADWAMQARGSDVSGKRAGFIELLQTAQTMAF